MKAPRLLFALTSAFVLLLLGALVAFNHQKPRLLVLHSYAEEGRWESAFNTGVQRALAHNRQPLALRWHYMTFTESEQPSPQEWAASAQRARSVIDRWQPAVVLAVGEEAQAHVARHYAGRTDVQVVYATGEEPARFGYATGAPNVTGVREMLPLQPLTELLAHLQSRPLRLRAIGVQDATGEAERTQLIAFDWGPHRLLSVTLAPDLPSWQQAVHAAQDADLLLVLSLAGLPQYPGHSTVTDTRALVQWTVQHAHPLALGVRESFVADGGTLAVVPAPEGLGQQVGTLALQALPGAAPRLPPPQWSQDFTIALRPQALAQRGLHLPSIYHQAARAAQALYEQPAPRAAALVP